MCGSKAEAPEWRAMPPPISLVDDYLDSLSVTQFDLPRQPLVAAGSVSSLGASEVFPRTSLPGAVTLGPCGLSSFLFKRQVPMVLN